MHRNSILLHHLRVRLILTGQHAKVVKTGAISRQVNAFRTMRYLQREKLRFLRLNWRGTAAYGKEGRACVGNRNPVTLHSSPYTLHPTPYTLHPTPHTLHPTPLTPAALTRHKGKIPQRQRQCPSRCQAGAARAFSVKRFRGGLKLKAHRLCVSLKAGLESNTEEE